MSILLLITIFALANNLLSLIKIVPQNPNYYFARIATALYDMSPEHKVDIHECGLPVTMVNGLTITSVISTFIKLLVGAILIVSFPTVPAIIASILFAGTVLTQRIFFRKELDFFMSSRGKHTRLAVAEVVTAILFYSSIFAAILSEIF